MSTPTPEQVREALAQLRMQLITSDCRPGCECWAHRALGTLESALAQPASEASPPPVEENLCPHGNSPRIECPLCLEESIGRMMDKATEGGGTVKDGLRALLGEEPPVEDPAVEEALAAANAKIDALCSGKERWRMSVPARPDSDPDLVISHALTLAERALDSLRSQGAAKDAEIERLRGALGTGAAALVDAAAEATIRAEAAEAQLAAAENRGFRAAADYLEAGWDDCGSETSWAWREIRDEADRREAKQ